MSPDALDVLDPDEWNRSWDARERARAERRRERAERRAARRPTADATLLRTRWGRALAGAVALLAMLTVGGLVALWPHGGRHGAPSAAMGGATQGAVVLRAPTVSCPGPVAQVCRRIVVRLTSGPRRGVVTGMTLGPVRTVARVATGAHVRVQPSGAPAGADPFAYAGPDRRATLLWIAIAFAVLVVALARLRGLLALAGFALSLLLVTRFLVPAILAGSPALPVALVGSLAVMFVTVLLTYGASPASLAACLGIAASLGVAAAAGTLAVHAAQLDGRSSELATYLAGVDRSLSLEGVALAGLVIGALGVLADMGVTQASAVMALRRANPELGARRLFSGGFAVGRDHLVATTHTLVLAYVGATLPLLLVMRSSGVDVTDAINTQDLAEPIVATLVGAMALLVSVPLTTALCAAVVPGIPVRALADSHAGHHH